MMRVLHHYWLCPESRFIRILLTELKLDFLPKFEEYWREDPAFLKLNIAGTVPVLVEDDGTTLIGAYVAAEYLDDIMPDKTLLQGNPQERAEIRRIFEWSCNRFNREVVNPLVKERLINRINDNKGPSSVIIRTALANLTAHLAYFQHLIERRPWLAGKKMTIADLMTAAALSVLDYMNDINWEECDEVKLWYSRIKSRPSFRPLLADLVVGMTPPPHYTDLDF